MAGEEPLFVVEEGTYFGYHYFNLAISGEHAAEAEALLSELLLNSGYEYVTSEDGNYYANEADHQVSFSELDGFTSILFFE